MNGRFNLCCNFGNVNLDLFTNFPDFIRTLLTGNSNASKNFRQHIRSYNSALAMASMGAKVDTPRGGGPYCYRIHGQVYHFVGPLDPEPGTRRQYGQLYILDTDDATAERLGNPANEGCDPLTMRELTAWFHTHNEYAASFKMMGDIVAEEERKAQLEQRAAPKIRMIFDSGRGFDRRRYNVPVTNEVAVVFVGEDNDVPATRSLAVHHKEKGLNPIQDIDGRCDPLTYPLFYPRGGLGWHVDLTKNASERIRTRITQREFYSYLLSVRTTFNPLHYASKLLQQFAVDAYVKIEQNRLNYTRTHQKELRIDSYQGLMDHLASDDAHEPAGQRVILPATFQGGPRAMHQSYQDAMAIVARYGKPDYFLTFTCNPKWREIKENLYDGQTASDRPDIVARVFHRKLEVLKENLFEKNILGRVAAYVGVVEWQKRGLPHCHMLLIMTANSKPRNSDQIDAVVQACLPDKATNPRLFDIVVSNMVHRNCGATSPTAPCMINGRCSKNFPKEFREETAISADGYPKYKRPNNGRSVQIGNEVFDNRHIVPYNRFLLMLLNAHINLEICGYVQAVKYLYKYVYKGPDRASLRLLQNKNDDHTDEIRAHLDARYVCSPEALHHIFMYECQFKSDTVCRLQVHLPNFQTVTFPSGGEREAVERGSTKDTTLTAWFKFNAEYEQLESESSILPGMVDPRTLYYHQLPEHFTYVKQTGKWKQRGRGNRQIGRMYMASPKHMERFSLRVLLLHRKNMRSFEDLRTVDDQQYPTFSAAARALGLLHDDAHYEHCLEEAACFQMPAELRALFCYLLAFCEVNDPSHLFELFKSDMFEDFVHRGATEEDAIAMAYYEMSDMLETLQWTEMFELLNHEQRLAANGILTSFDVGTCKLHFVDGPGGSGKTFLYSTIYHILKGQRRSIVCVAWTGIAASLLPEGRTASSMFKLNMQSGNRDCMLRRECKDALPLKNADVIIWDEISMVPKHSLEAVDLLLKDLMCNTLPFGGKIIVLGGDFRQVLPIAEHGTESSMIDMCVKNSHIWAEFRKHTLSVNMRTGESDMSWCNFLIKVGDGEAEEDDEGCIEIPQDITSNGDLIEEVFGNQISNTDILTDRAILAPRNIDVYRINEEALCRLPGEIKEYKSIDEVTSDEYCEYSTEFLNSLSPAGLPPHNLRLKKGAIVILLRNLNVKKGLCNGTRLIVTHFGQHVIGCVFASGERKGQFVLIPKIDNLTDKGVPVRVRRRQFPVRLAFAMTINKAQGQSLTSVGIHLGTDIFSHGQLYVALSRSRTKEGVKVLKNGTRVRNIVIKEVL
ncbi:unnamed protein product [Cylicostephanus goldi]|uniref:ATP-dependent DNA helicase n=1 Tax=Cylicostephanus goldi TaxID=71465 RepID=A0A3P6RLC2_CYLGO|nr:unnamed protein product [Cylicostephanus goldi]